MNLKNYIEQKKADTKDYMHLCELLEQAKLIDRVRNQNTTDCWSGHLDWGTREPSGALEMCSIVI